MSDKDKWHRDIYDAIDAIASGDSPKSNILISEAYVTEVRTTDKRVRVSLLPDDIDMGWIRLYMQGINNNWSFGMLPTVGNTVVVLFPRGQRDSAICLAGGVAEGEDRGSPMLNSLELDIHDANGNKITMNSNGIQINCNRLVYNNGLKPVARVGDKVATPFGPMLIIEGNNDFLA